LKEEVGLLEWNIILQEDGKFTSTSVASLEIFSPLKQRRGGSDFYLLQE